MLEAQLEDKQRELESINNIITTSESLSDLFGVETNSAGVAINETSAMKTTAVFACVQLISGAIGSLPVNVFTLTDNGREENNSHPVYKLLHSEPNPMVSAITYWETVVSQMLLSGNSYSIIGRRGATPNALTLLNPKQVYPFKKDGRLLYDVLFDEGRRVVFDQDDILHIPGIGWDGLKGFSVISYAAQTIGITIAAEEHSGKFFSNGAVPGGIIKFDKKMNREQIELILEYWNKKHAGSGNSHTPGVLTEGGDFQEISMNAVDSQLIESRRFQIADIARVFQVPPHMIGETEKSTSWGTGIEQQGIGFVTYNLRRYLKRIEQEINRKLFRNDGSFAKFNVAALLRGDTKARHESYQIALGGNQQPGWMTINEVRKLENLTPDPEGNTLYKPITGDAESEDSPSFPDSLTINEKRALDGNEPIEGGDAIYMPSSQIPAIEIEEGE